MKTSLRFQLFFYIFIGLAIILISMSYSLYTSMRLQNMMDRQFETERFFQELQQDVLDIQAPFLDFLSSRSSKALSTLLMESQKLRQVIPSNYPISHDQVELKKREVFQLLISYLDLMDDAIQFKRGRAIEEYIELYDIMADLNSYISSQIDQISLHGFREQMSVYEGFVRTSRSLQFWNLILVLSAFLFSILLMLLSMKKVTDPMDRLSAMAGELAGGNFSVDDIHVDSVDEVHQVVEAFNGMKNDIRQYITELNRQKEIEQHYMDERLRNLKMEQLLKRMELYTMQAQMNPHFLFNTINTGVQLAILEDADKTSEFMQSLAEFLRHNIREKKFIVSLRHEIDGLWAYFNILRIRFPKTLELNLNVAEELLDSCFIPSMMLQPLVENCVIHAFKGMDCKGLIEVEICKDEHVLKCFVRDNGIGIPAEKASALLSHKTRESEYSSKVMGLENVIQRLYFFYPKQEHIINIMSEPGRGTEISITIDTREQPCIQL